MSDPPEAKNENRAGESAKILHSPVNSHNEWDPLEEVLVGRLDGATTPSRHPIVSCNVPPWADQFVALLQSLGITVTRPDAVDHRRRFSTPDWSSRGFCNTCPGTACW